jgi:PAS domain-containing protein
MVHDPRVPREEALVLNLEDTPDLGIRRSLKPQFLPRNALDYLAPRSRIAYFFDSASNVPGSWLRELRPRAAIAEPAERAAPGGRVARQPSEAAWLVDGQSLTVCGINRAALRLLGLKPERALGVRPTLLCGSLEDETFWMGAEQDPYARIRSDTVLTHSDGHPRWVSRSISPFTCRVVTTTGWCCCMTRPAGAAPRPSARRCWRVAGHAGIHRRRHPGRGPRGPGAQLQSPLRQALGPAGGLQHEPGDAGLWLSLQRVMRDGEQYRARIEALLEAPLMRSSDVLRLADGRVLEQVSLPQMSRGEPIGRVFSFRDLSEKLAAHQRIEELGRSDVLTGAPNRVRCPTASCSRSPAWATTPRGQVCAAACGPGPFQADQRHAGPQLRRPRAA